MVSSAKNISLTSYDELFDATDVKIKEKVQEILIEELHSFFDHPFKVLEDKKMEETKESIKTHGVLVPILVRPRGGGGYEIISGHRRKHACSLLGITKIPAIIRNLSDDEAAIIMVDSNIQRENLLYSEKAFAYKMKLEAIKQQGERNDLTSTQVGQKLSVEVIAEQFGESRNQIQRYIRLTELIPNFLDLIDKKKTPFNVGVELSYLKPLEQNIVYDITSDLKVKPTLNAARELKDIICLPFCTHSGNNVYIKFSVLYYIVLLLFLLPYSSFL